MNEAGAPDLMGPPCALKQSVPPAEMSGGPARAAAVRLLQSVARHSSACPCHGCMGGLLGPAAAAPAVRGLRRFDRAGSVHAGAPDPAASTDYAFEMASSNIRYGRGVTQEVGLDLRNLRADNVCVVTDPAMSKLRPMETALRSLERAGVKFTVFDEVSVEPTDVSFKAAIEFARARGFDAFLAVGGGSTMDTAKVMNLYSAVPDAEFLDFVNSPIGKGLPVPATASMKPLIAVPTTAGTGSETTGVAIFDHTPLQAKTGIGNRLLRPTLGIVDPDNTSTMPAAIAAASGFDVLCHALEAYTALPYHQRSPRPADPKLRPAYQGSNPISDVWCSETLRLLSGNFVQAVNGDDPAAKERMALAATYAGIGFGNAGVHLCHGLSYPISGLNKGYVHPGYEHAAKKLIPHGVSVAVPAPAVFRFTAAACPERHLEAARLLGADVSRAPSGGGDGSYAGGILADRVQFLMEELGVPTSLSKLGFTSEDIPALVDGALPQQRVTQLSPHGTPDAEALAHILEDAM